MKLAHALGFFAIGYVMFKLPEFAPRLCPNDFYGNSVRASWLHVMGLTQLAIGAIYGLRRAASWAAGWLEKWPEMIAASMAETAPQPQSPSPASPVVSMPRPGLADVIPVEFKPVWSDQRPAAA
jgi:hypothetical protein